MGFRELVSVRGWTLWAQRRSLIAYCLLLMAAALTVTIAGLAPVTATDLGILGALAALGLAQAELGRKVERVRRRIADSVHVNMTSVWMLPAVLLVPLPLVAVLAVTFYWHQHFRSCYRTARVPAYRSVTSASIVILTCYVTGAASAATGIDGIRGAIETGWGGVCVVTVSIATYFVVNTILVIPALRSTTRDVRNLIGSWGDNLLELSTLCLGAITAVVFAVQPAVAALVMPPLFLLHRTILVNQLESAARHDDKTGLWNAAGWHRIASRELSNEDMALGVLMIDLDLFKRINDTYGHLGGDSVLKAVADTITATVRRRDSVGRFGGEEFVVLLPGMTEPAARAVAERIRAAIATLEIPFHDKLITGLSASIGIAVHPDSGTTVERLIQAADTAMYRAKAAGRNQVVG